MNELFQDPVFLIMFVIVAGGFLAALTRILRIRLTGIKAVATVVGLAEHDDFDGDGMKRTIEVFVSYQTEDGRFIEGTLSNPSWQLSIGNQIRIRYDRDDPEHPVYTGKA